MSDLELTPLGFRAGHWEGRLTGSRSGQIQVLQDGDPLPDLEIRAESGGHRILSVPIPSERLSEGTTTFVVRDADSGEDIGGFSITVGEADPTDTEAELRLLRAELDLLKQAFRRHIRES